MKSIIATDYHGRTIMGIKGHDESEMWKKGDTIWGQRIKPTAIKTMDGDSMEDLDFFKGECDTQILTFASDKAAAQYDKWVESL